MKVPLRCNVNGDPREILVEPRQTLLEVLREEMDLTGVKEGCSNGNCGSCTVIMDGVSINSCCAFGLEAEGKEITTVEGLAQEGQLDPLQEAFIEGGAMQCGICTPGFLMSAKHLLEVNPHPTEHEIRLGIAGNLCRCTGYDKIVRAIAKVAAG